MVVRRPKACAAAPPTEQVLERRVEMPPMPAEEQPVVDVSKPIAPRAPEVRRARVGRAEGRSDAPLNSALYTGAPFSGAVYDI